MNLIIRQARREDATVIAPLIYDAIGDIANRLTGETEPTHIITELEALVQETTNRHSFLNTFVATQNDNVLGIVVLYDGKRGRELDALLVERLQAKKARTIKIDLEAYDEEYYLDTICVAPNARGLGIGTKLLAFAEEKGRELGYKKLSLNVETEKDKARQLYERFGFIVTEPWIIIEEKFHHMVKEL